MRQDSLRQPIRWFFPEPTRLAMNERHARHYSETSLVARWVVPSNTIRLSPSSRMKGYGKPLRFPPCRLCHYRTLHKVLSVIKRPTAPAILRVQQVLRRGSTV